MSHLADLQRAIQAAIASKRLGRPLFLRYTLFCRDKQTIVSQVAQATATAARWLAQANEADELHRLYAVGSLESGHVAVTLQLRNGGTALASASTATADSPAVDVMVIGDHGTAFFDLTQEIEVSTMDFADEPDRRIMALIEQSLRSGKPEPREGRP